MTSRVAGAVTLGVALTVASPVSAQQQGSRSHWSDIQGFNIVLLVGELQGTSGPVDDLPQGARRALTDMKEFLPYKHYRVLDSQWTSCCGPTPVRLTGRLQGVYSAGPTTNEMKLYPRPYGFRLDVSSSSAGLQIQFNLQEEGTTDGRRIPADIERQIAEARDELAKVETEIQAADRLLQEGLITLIHVNKLKARHASLQQNIAALQQEGVIIAQVGRNGGRSLINSSFTMDVGETVVVGTSRLGGDKALIALVTAAKRSGAVR